MDILEQIEAILDRATQDFDGRDEVLRRAAVEIRALRATRAVRHVPAVGDTLSEMRDNVRNDALYRTGDVSLVWANQGDLIMSALAMLEEPTVS